MSSMSRNRFGSEKKVQIVRRACLLVLLFGQLILLWGIPVVWSRSALSLLAVWFVFSSKSLVRRIAILLPSALAVALVPSLDFLSTVDKQGVDEIGQETRTRNGDRSSFHQSGGG